MPVLVIAEPYHHEEELYFKEDKEEREISEFLCEGFSVFSNGYEFALRIEDFRNRCIKGFRNLEGEKHRGVRVTVFNAHNGLSAHSYPHREFFLSHAFLKTKNANAIADGHLGHGNL